LLRRPPVKFYFHVRDGDVLLRDEEGEELADLESARTHAVEGARDILSEAAQSGKAASINLKLEVADELGHTILVVPVGHAAGTDTQG
jgi:hypothetical protein